MRISDWSSDVCSSDLLAAAHIRYEIGNLTQILARFRRKPQTAGHAAALPARRRSRFSRTCAKTSSPVWAPPCSIEALIVSRSAASFCSRRSEEHTSELQSLMRISYAVFCLKKKTKTNVLHTDTFSRHNEKTTYNI